MGLEDTVTKAGVVLTQLKKEGIDIDIITQELEDEGIEKFNKDYDEILEAINTKKLKQLI